MQPGTRLGPYEVVSRIGAGGMGEVWKARDTRLDRIVAIKVLPADFAADAQLKIRFEREAKTISQFEHPNICRLYDVGDDYLVMELLEGESLAEKLAKGALPLTDVVKYGSQIADALDRAHRAGVVHRDLKPGNIMITRSGAKLLDFGLAKSAIVDISTDGATVQKPLTAQGAIVGTFQYMAPEQLEGEEADPRTDIFSLGAVLYEMATGKRAFDGKTKTSLIASIVKEQPRAIREIQPLVPAVLEHVVRRCLEKDREHRWQSAADIAEELRWIGESRDDAPASIRSAKPSRAIAFAGLLAIVAASIFATLWLKGRGTKQPRFSSSVLPPAGSAFNFEAGAMVLSPDGRWLVFPVRAADSTLSLYLRDFRTGEMRHLDGTNGVSHPFWSPDSKYVGYFAEGKLRAIDIGGGPPQVIVEAPEARGGAWSEQGTIVFAPRFREGLYSVPAQGGTPVELTRLAKGEISHRWPMFLPDGDHVVFLAQRAEGGSVDDPSTIDVISLSTKKRQELFRANSSICWSPSGYLLYWRDGSLMAQQFDAKRVAITGAPIAVAPDVSYSGTEQAIVSVSRTNTLVYQSGKLGQSRLVWSSRNGINDVATPQSANMFGPAVSPDAKRIAVSAIDQTEDVHVIDLERGTNLRLTFDSTDEDSPVWSPDGEWIAFRSNRSDGGDIYRKKASGEGGEEPLLVSPESTRPTSWSPDGKQLLLEASDSRHGTSSDIWVYSFDTKNAVPLIQSPFTERGATFSPDGRWIAYQSDESGRDEVYLRPVNGAAKWQVSTGGGRMPKWRRDGSEVFFSAPGDAVMVAKIAAESMPVKGKPELLFTYRQKATPLLRRDVPSFDVAPDGQRLLLNALTANVDAPVTVVQNWDEILAPR